MELRQRGVDDCGDVVLFELCEVRMKAVTVLRRMW